MGEAKKQAIGSIGWRDLTVENADDLRDFYAAVVGWKTESVNMGGYNDYVMVDANGEHVSGVCHARGENAEIPPQWMMYVVVEIWNKASLRRPGAAARLLPRRAA